MSNALLIHDLADAIMRERLQQAAQQALLTQLRAAERPSSLDHLPAFIRQSVGRRRASWPRRATRRLSRSPAGARRRCFFVDVILMELLLIIFLLVVLNLAATRWGFDSRAAFRLIRH